MARKRKLKRRVGTAGKASGMLPLMLPGPRQPPEFIVDPTDTQGGAGNYVTEHKVRSGSKLEPYSRAHEKFHTMDWDEFSDEDRAALARILRPKYQGEWWGETGGESGPGSPSETAADYYAAAKTKLKFVPRKDKKSGMTVADQALTYTNFNARKMREFELWLDQWARNQQYTRPLRP